VYKGKDSLKRKNIELPINLRFVGHRNRSPLSWVKDTEADESVEADKGTEMTVGNETAEGLYVIMDDVGHLYLAIS
jgi:hypothetical protein